MPRFIKFILTIFLILLAAVIGLKMSGNDHILEAVRSTYAIGRTGPDIDNYKFFENRTVAKGKKQNWKDAPVKAELTEADKTVMESYKTTSFLVLHKGQIVCEEYWEDYDATTPSNSFSMAKTIVGLLVGFAVEEGKIGSVKDKASDYLVELKDTDREDVTIEQLLQMTSGIGFDESYGDPFGFMAQAYYGDELIEKTFSYPQATEPGSEWVYLGGNTLLLSFIVQRTTRKTLSEYASKKLWKPLGAEQEALWTIDESTGAERAYCCFYSNARDFAKLGQLMLCDGNWKEEQLISPQWLENTTTPVILNDGSKVPYYGYQIWMDSIKGQEVTYFRGILGQYIFIIPEKEMVVVRLGHERSATKIGNSPSDVYEFLEIANRLVP